MVKTELLAGCTTFVTMAYIAFVNPMLLSAAGMDFGAVFVATILTTALTTTAVGLTSGYPFAIAPGMGLNAFFAYTVVLQHQIPWQTALGACLVAGVILIFLNIVGLRTLLLQAIPHSLRAAISSGIGLFLAFIGLQNLGVIAPDSQTLLTLGTLGWPALFGAIGLILIAALFYFRISSAFLITILTLWIGSLLLGLQPWEGFIAYPPSLMPTLFQLDLHSLWDPKVLYLTLSMVIVTLFDATGSLIALGKQGKFLDTKGNLPHSKRVLMFDGMGTMIGSLLGTSNVTIYLESSAGIQVGGRTALTSLTVALLFIGLLFFSPLASSLPLFATAPILITIGALFAKEFSHIDWKDPTEWIPAFVILIGIPLTFSIADGIALGLILHPVGKLLTRRAREVHPLIWALAALFLTRFVMI